MKQENRPTEGEGPAEPVNGGGYSRSDHLGALFELQGLGHEYWVGVDPDEYVRKLREGWG